MNFNLILYTFIYYLYSGAALVQKVKNSELKRFFIDLFHENPTNNNGKTNDYEMDAYMSRQKEMSNSPTSPYGSRTNPGISCSNIEKTLGKNFKPDVYWIKTKDNELANIICYHLKKKIMDSSEELDEHEENSYQREDIRKNMNHLIDDESFNRIENKLDDELRVILDSSKGNDDDEHPANSRPNEFILFPIKPKDKTNDNKIKNPPVYLKGMNDNNAFIGKSLMIEDDRPIQTKSIIRTLPEKNVNKRIFNECKSLIDLASIKIHDKQERKRILIKLRACLRNSSENEKHQTSIKRKVPLYQALNNLLKFRVNNENEATTTEVSGNNPASPSIQNTNNIASNMDTNQPNVVLTKNENIDIIKTKYDQATHSNKKISRINKKKTRTIQPNVPQAYLLSD